jgi:hypothetical protein
MCLQPAGGQEREADVKAGQDSFFCNLGIFWECSENFRTFQTIWEIPKLTLSRETQKLGAHATLERTLTRLKIIFRSGLGDLASTSEIKKSRSRRNSRTFGNFWDFLGTFGILGTFPEICYLPKRTYQLTNVSVQKCASEPCSEMSIRVLSRFKIYRQFYRSLGTYAESYRSVGTMCLCHAPCLCKSHLTS